MSNFTRPTTGMLFIASSVLLAGCAPKPPVYERMTDPKAAEEQATIILEGYDTDRIVERSWFDELHPIGFFIWGAYRIGEVKVSFHPTRTTKGESCPDQVSYWRCQKYARLIEPFNPFGLKNDKRHELDWPDISCVVPQLKMPTRVYLIWRNGRLELLRHDVLTPATASAPTSLPRAH